MQIDMNDSRSAFIQGLLLALSVDNKISNTEITALLYLLRENPDLAEASVLAPFRRTLNPLLARNYISKNEFTELRSIICQILEIPVLIEEVNHLESIPFDEINTIKFSRQIFVVTGRFQIGRENVEEYIEKMGGELREACSSKVDYLIVGSEGEPTWKFGNYGTKIEAAVKLKNSGRDIFILSEEKFVSLVNDPLLAKTCQLSGRSMFSGKGRGHGGITLTKIH